MMRLTGIGPASSVGWVTFRRAWEAEIRESIEAISVIGSSVESVRSDAKISTV